MTSNLESFGHIVCKIILHNVLVLKNDVEIFLATHLEVKFDFLTYSNENTSKLVYKHIGERKNHSIDSLYLQNDFEMSKNSKRMCKKHI